MCRNSPKPVEVRFQTLLILAKTFTWNVALELSIIHLSGNQHRPIASGFTFQIRLTSSRDELTSSAPNSPSFSGAVFIPYLSPTKIFRLRLKSSGIFHTSLIHRKVKLVFFRKVEKERWRHVTSSAIRVTCQIRSLLHECNSSLRQPTPSYSEVPTHSHPNPALTFVSP